jgi:hypothetical protein
MTIGKKFKFLFKYFSIVFEDIIAIKGMAGKRYLISDPG